MKFINMVLVIIALSLFGVANASKVLIQTNMGDIKVELADKKAPKTVANFLKYVKKGHYKNTIFHRVINGFMIQGGGFDTNFKKKPTEITVVNEADNGLKNTNGTIAMARTSDPHSASAQFFINVNENQFLDHKNKSMRGWGYAVFGKVTSGMNVVNNIKSLKTGAKSPFSKDVPVKTVVIKNIKILK